MSNASILPLRSDVPTRPVALPAIANPHRPLISAAMILAVDVAVVWTVLWAFLAAIARQDAGAGLPLWPLLGLCLTLLWICGAYPAISLSPTDELKRIILGNACAFFFVSLLLAFQGAPLRSHVTCAAAATGVSVAMSIVRSAVRRVGSQFDWWGYPAAVFGGGKLAVSLTRKLKSQPYIGLRPVALITDTIAEARFEGIPVCSLEHLEFIASHGVKHAIVAAPELSQSQFAEVLERSGNAFPHLTIMPDNEAVWKTGGYTRDLAGRPGLQLRNNLLHPGSRAAKRVLDLAFCILLTPFVLPLMIVIALLIAAESGFPVFYSQRRLGHDGQPFRIWKFRTMVRNAGAVLQRTLDANPELRREWAENHKLRDDPRITAVGKFLRKTSLDELPQLWNVLKGEMSWVGPRPIVREEIPKYKEAYSLYVKTTPGLTGLWQVSGRNHTTYAERVAYDAYYVRNWSVWMDLYLLAKTVTVVLTGDGAY